MNSIEILITIVGGLSAAFKWIYEYSKKLEWEKNKLLLMELEKFNSLEYTKVMERILDWNGTKVVIDGYEFRVDDELLLSSIQTHDVKHKFTKEEVLIRKVVDDYFNNLTKLIFMSKAELINEENLKMFLDYWFNILSGKRKSKSNEIISAIDNYMYFYDFDELKKFLVKNYTYEN